MSITTLAHLWIFLYKYETIYYKQRNVCGRNRKVESFLKLVDYNTAFVQWAMGNVTNVIDIGRKMIFILRAFR